MFRSCVAGVQISYNTVPNVTSLYKDPRSISRVSRLLGRGREVLADRKFSIWNFLRGSARRSGKWFAKFETAYKSVVVSPSVLHPTEDSDVASEPQTLSNSESPTARLNLGNATVAFELLVGPVEQRRSQRSQRRIELLRHSFHCLQVIFIVFIFCFGFLSVFSIPYLTLYGSMRLKKGSVKL